MNEKANFIQGMYNLIFEAKQAGVITLKEQEDLLFVLDHHLTRLIVWKD